MHYIICFKNGAGHTQRSEYKRIKNDAAALEYAREWGDYEIIEIWQGCQLVTRLVRAELADKGVVLS